MNCLLSADPRPGSTSRSSFFFMDPSTTEIYTLSLHDALPIFADNGSTDGSVEIAECAGARVVHVRSEEHTSELQSRQYLVCRLLLEKKKTRESCHRAT